MKIAFIGLGIMGSRMAANLAKAGHHLYIFNRTASKADELISDKVEWANSPAEAAINADIVITMLSTPEVVQEVAMGENGFLPILGKGNVWIDCSTVNPSFSEQMAAICHEMGFSFLDAPVAGSLQPAQNGELTFLVGGNKSIVRYCTPVFKAMGKKIIHAGESGQGSALKLVNNLIMGLSMYAFTEGLLLGDSLGLEKETIFGLLDGSPIAAPMIQGKKDKYIKGDFSVEFPLQWLQKDLHLAAQTAYENGIALPGTNTVKELFGLAKQAGYAELDFTSIYEYLSKGKKPTINKILFKL